MNVVGLNVKKKIPGIQNGLEMLELTQVTNK